MDTTEFFASKWLRGDDLRGRQYRGTIKDVTVEDVRDKDGGTTRKVAVHFAGVPKPLLLNRTNYETLVAICGSRDSEAWLGKSIVILPERIVAFGQHTIAVRLREDRPQPAPAPKPAPQGEPADWFADEPQGPVEES